MTALIEDCKHTVIVDREWSRWDCPLCGTINYARQIWNSTRVQIGGPPEKRNGRVQVYGFAPIMTPRIYNCHNHSCHVRRLYWRANDESIRRVRFVDVDVMNVDEYDRKVKLFARYFGKYETLDILTLVSDADPIKYYAKLLAQPAPNQLNLLSNE